MITILLAHIATRAHLELIRSVTFINPQKQRFGFATNQGLNLIQSALREGRTAHAV